MRISGGILMRINTIPDKKYLKIELQEQNGGRGLELEVRNKTILKARKI